MRLCSGEFVYRVHTFWLIAVFLKPLLSNLYGVAGLGEVATNGLVNDNQKMYLDIYISRSEWIPLILVLRA